VKGNPLDEKKKRWNFHREKNNTTSSLYIKDTIENPDVDEVIRCMSVALLFHMKNAETQPNPRLYDIFDERIHPLMPVPVDLSKLPEASMVYKFISIIFKVQRFPAEVAILVVAYVERVIAKSGVCLHKTNWRRMVVGAIVIASKIWEEESVWNVDFLSLFPNLSVNELNTLEWHWLELLQFEVSLKSSEYVKYYFELRALSSLDAQHFPLEPMPKEAVEQLEEKSLAREAKMRSSHVKRSKSVDEIKTKSRVILQ